jgi:aspartate kinase
MTLTNSQKKVVSKFGGTSMGDAACMLRSAEVTHKQNSFIVAVSATSGTTNLLIELGQKAEKRLWNEAEKILNTIQTKHEKIADDLKAGNEAHQKLSALFEEMNSLAKGIHLLRDCSTKAMDTLVSLGERMSSVLFTEALRSVKAKAGSKQSVILVDARDFIKTDEQFGKARPLIDLIEEKCKAGLTYDSNKVYVTQGFIGSTREGLTTTLGRGGSDYSAALFAEAVNADILEIWTDVAGIATTDPRLYPQAQILPEVSFQETSELATFGAKVLHPATLAPAMRKNIPVFVGSSFDPEQKGTWVRKEVSNYPLVRALALRKKQVLVTLTSADMLHAHGFLFRIFKVFNDHKVSIDAITTSEISVSMTLDDSTLLNKKLLQELSEIAEVHVEENLSLVSLIGNNINHTPGLSQKIFTTVSDINVRMICYGASKHNFCFLVAEDKGPEAIQRLHKAFIP